MNNMALYDEVRQPPDNALKKITGGRLSGMTDISPQWRIETLTKQFGICGVGWKYEIKEKRIENGANDEKAAFVEIALYVKNDGVWSDPIPGLGGSMFVAKERNGLYVSDEAEKMALTNAISVACKALGIAADVYWGRNDTKYGRQTSSKESAPSASGDMTPEQAANVEIKFGKHSGKTIREIYKSDRPYLDWMMSEKCTNDFLKKVAGIVLNAANNAKQNKSEPDYEAFSQVDIDESQLPWYQGDISA